MRGRFTRVLHATTTTIRRHRRWRWFTNHIVQLVIATHALNANPGQAVCHLCLCVWVSWNHTRVRVICVCVYLSNSFRVQRLHDVFGTFCTRRTVSVSTQFNSHQQVFRNAYRKCTHNTTHRHRLTLIRHCDHYSFGAASASAKRHLSYSNRPTTTAVVCRWWCFRLQRL